MKRSIFLFAAAGMMMFGSVVPVMAQEASGAAASSDAAAAPAASSAAAAAPIAPPALPAPQPPPSSPSPQPLPVVSHVEPSIMAAISRAKTMLADDMMKAEQTRKKPRIVWSKKAALDLTLAVWNRVTDIITLVPATKHASTLTVPASAGIIIKISRNNNINSQYAFQDPNLMVVGERYPILREVKVKKKKGYELHDELYVPYSEALYTPEVLAAGSDYLSYLIARAFDDLRARGVRSRAFPNQLLVDAIDPYLVKSVIVIEHSDAQIFRDVAPEASVGRVLVSLAINQDDGYDFSVSKAGARGIAQFIPSTYRHLVHTRPDLGLMDDFVAGTSDHKNAIKAQVALLDADLADMPPSVRQIYQHDKMVAGAFMAASYNGGSTRVKRALAYWQDGWADSHEATRAALESKSATLKSKVATLKHQVKKLSAKPKKKKDLKIAKGELIRAQQEYATTTAALDTVKKSSLFHETVLYVQKMKRVYAMLTGGLFATPNVPTGALPVAAVGAPSALAVAAPTPGAGISIPEISAPQTPSKICFSDGGCVSLSNSATP